MFRAQTYRIIRVLPPIDYTEVEHQIKQSYLIGYDSGQVNHKMMVDLHAMKPIEQEAWQVADSIGKFGHPLIREFVRHGSRY